MAREKRHNVKGYDGVYYVLRKPPGSKRPEKVYYIRYRKFDEKKGKIALIEEKAGWEKRNDMTPARAFLKRARKISGEEKTNAEEREAEKLAKHAEKLAKQAEANKWTIQRLWDEYESQKELNKSLKTDKSRFKLYLQRPFGHKEPQDILQLDVDRLRVKLLKKKSPQTVKHILALLKRLVKFGSDRGLCDSLPFAITFPKVDNDKTDFLAPDEMERLLKAIREDKHPIAGKLMLMVLNTGMRRGELFRLKWTDIDYHNNTITLQNPKGGKIQRIPLNDGAKEVLASIKRTKSPYVFAGRGGKQRVDINKALKVIKDAAGLPKEWRPLHSLRHHFASMLASSGEVTPFALQTLLTHKDLRMTSRYSHLFDEAAKKASNVASDIIGAAMKE